MKFRVREGFVCQIETIQRDGDGREIARHTNTFPGGTDVEFDAVTAEAHKHKLEAADKSAAKFLAPLVVESVSVTPEQVAEDHAESIASLPK